MIAEYFTLKKNSWHVKLMKEIWGYTHRDFPNMCPYFWLSIFNVLISPIYFLSKATTLIVLFIIKPIRKVGTRWVESWEEKV